MSAGAVVAWLPTRPLADPSGCEAVLALAARASRALGAPLHALVLGETPPELLAAAGRAGVVRVQRAGATGRGPLGPDAAVALLARWIAAESPRLVVFDPGFDARAVAARAAARSGAAVLINGADVELAGEALRITTAAYGGDTRAVYEVAAGSALFLGVQASAVAREPAAAAGGPPAVEDLALDPGEVVERVRVLEPAKREGPRLEEAQLVVAGGRGLGARENWKLVEELAAALGGLAAASRPLVDEGWVDSSRQVGLTGRVTRPALYLAVGISGASQHMAGCSGARTLVAINRDPDAAIFRYARFGVVGDCLELLPELIREARRGASGDAVDA
jgi:electron transfer flavoprotein alpha subunit